jgi:hypothetical protein
MKNIFLILLALVSLTCSAQKVGIVENGTFIITNDLTQVKTDWETLLKAQKNNSELEAFTIKSGVDSTLQTTYYMLTAVTRDKTAKVAGYLELKNQTFTLVSYPYGTVICIGCENACIPARKNGNWICAGGCPGAECNKTETIRK